jgi:hypothetical protein
MGWKLQVLNEVKTCSSNPGCSEKFSVTIFPCLFSHMVSKFCATITKITDFTNHGTQN